MSGSPGSSPAKSQSKLPTQRYESEDEEDEPTFPRPRPSSQVLGEKTQTSTHLLILCVLIMLAFDTLNPVKRVSMLLGIPVLKEASGWLCVGLLLFAVLQDIQNVIFGAGRVFFNSLLSIFISRIDVIGLENIPQHGPAILVANHHNQFIDGMCILCACPQRRISFIVARKSYSNGIVGFFARAMAAVPVTRPQDVAFRGSGALLSLHAADSAELTLDGKPCTKANHHVDSPGDGSHTSRWVNDSSRRLRLVGSEACRFGTEFKSGDKLAFTDGQGRGMWTCRVVNVETHSVCWVQIAQGPVTGSPPSSPSMPPLPTSPPCAAAASESDAAEPWTLPADGRYRILPRGDYESVFTDVVFTDVTFTGDHSPHSQVTTRASSRTSWRRSRMAPRSECSRKAARMTGTGCTCTCTCAGLHVEWRRDRNVPGRRLA